MNFDMSDQKKAFWDGFFSVFNFGSFLNPSDGLPDNLDGIRAKLSWGFEKDRENLQKDGEKIWGKMIKEEELKSNEDGRGELSNEI